MQLLYQPAEPNEEANQLKNLCFIDKHMIDSLGPSHYNPKLEVTNKSVKTPIWSRALGKREPAQNPTDPNPGPGHYNQ